MKTLCPSSVVNDTRNPHMFLLSSGFQASQYLEGSSDVCLKT